MRRCNVILLFLVLCTLSVSVTQAQDSSVYSKLYNLPDKFFSRISVKSQDIEQKLTRQTEKYLARLANQERKLQKKLWKKDSVAAKQLFGDVDARYADLQSKLANGQQVYSGRLDSLQTALRFIDANKLTVQSPAVQEKLKATLTNYASLQGKLNQTSDIKKYLKERQQYLKQHIEKFGLAKEFKRFQKDVYYYRAQVDEYRRVWEDPSKLEAKLLQLANKIPAFKDFSRQHSMLAGMFRLPGGSTTASATPIPGLQTRASIQQSMVARFGTDPDVTQAVQQNIQSAQAHINQLKDKVAKLGGGSSDMDMPDFKPNSQKTKSFWKRVELGANVQSVKNTRFFPVTSDLALSAGYKLSDKSVVGVGLSYKVGWGQNIRHIKVTHEGIGLRSFLDVKLKGSFYASGGFEYNYQQPFQSMQQLYGLDSWQQSGLLGISKVISVKSKLFKKTRVQLLWDFLSYQQVPRSQPVLFRVGYGFN